MLHWIRSLLVVTVCLCSSTAPGQTPPSLQVLKIAAGPAGVESNGIFTLTEERARFSRSADKEVVVHFQWEGTAGTKKLEAIWRSPDGASSSKSVVEYVARTRRFGAYWRFALSPDMQLGTWAVEATVDG